MRSTPGSCDMSAAPDRLVAEVHLEVVAREHPHVTHDALEAEYYRRCRSTRNL